MIAHEKGEVALIATTDPPLSRLRDILISRLTHKHGGSQYEESGFVYRKQLSPTQHGQKILGRLSSMLERVKISRVFDFPGLAEAVTEFSARLEDSDRGDQANRSRGEGKIERSIADSEDEAEDNLSSRSDERRYRSTTLTEVSTTGSKRPPASMLIVDNIANVVGSLMTKSQVQGNVDFPLSFWKIHFTHSH